MTEFAVGVAMLGALTLGTISVVNLQEVQRRSIVAAREAAFQSAWLAQRIDVESLRYQLALAHFNDAGLTTATGSPVLRPADVLLASRATGSPGRGAAAAEFVLAPLRVAGGFLGGGFDLADSGFHSGEVGAHLNNTSRLPEPFRGLPLRFNQPFAVLGNDWSAAGPAHVARRAGGLVPSHMLAPLSNIWRPLSAPLALFEPSLRDLCFGLIEPDRVPEDRLSPGLAQGRPSCP
jgi:hypothetical protein